MTIKKLITIALSAALLSATAVSVSAATLTDQETTGQSKVLARIDGSTPTGITYKISIPDTIDFGTLVQPANADNSYKAIGYNVKLDEVNGLDPTTQHIAVYVKDPNASMNEDQNFYITNNADSKIAFKYSVFKVPADQVQDSMSLNSNPMTKPVGFPLDNFSVVGDEVNGTLVINQAQLYGKSLADIAGEYSGYMVFFSAVEDN